MSKERNKPYFNNDVKELSIDNFSKNGKLLQEKKGNSIVMFYATWCGACNQTKPIFEEFAKIVKDNKIPVNVYCFDYHKNKEKYGNLMRSWKFRIGGYPTIIAFNGAVPYSYYSGYRTPRKLIRYSYEIGKKN